MPGIPSNGFGPIGEKSQQVRLIDVFVLGPFLTALSFNKRLRPWQRAGLFASGVLTIIYNGHNYLINRK